MNKDRKMFYAKKGIIVTAYFEFSIEDKKLPLPSVYITKDHWWGLGPTRRISRTNRIT